MNIKKVYVTVLLFGLYSIWVHVESEEIQNDLLKNKWIWYIFQPTGAKILNYVFLTNPLYILTSHLNIQMAYIMNRAISFKRSISQFVAEINFKCSVWEQYRQKNSFSSVLKARRVYCSFKCRITVVCNVTSRWHVSMSTFGMSLFYLRFAMVCLAIKYRFKVC